MRLSSLLKLSSLAVLGACSRSGDWTTHELTGATMGTTFSVTLVLPAGQVPDGELQARIEQVVDEVEQSMSTYLLQSEVSKFNTNLSTDWFSVSVMLCEAVDATLAISELSQGAFDITVGPLVNLWGFGPDGGQLEPPGESMIETARARVGYAALQVDCAQPAIRKLKPDVYIDLSGFAKGLAADRLAALIDDAAHYDYLIEIGGELRMRGHNGNGDYWRIAIEMPADDGRTVRRLLALSDTAMATSGDYRNFFEFEGNRYSHTIDPRRARPVSHNLAAVTVVADSAAFADAMATALLVLGPKDGMQLATRHDIAAYFQIRAEAGFEETMSPAFRQIAAAD
jgi:thiamine biosynthesis lipoprotein